METVRETQSVTPRPALRRVRVRVRWEIVDLFCFLYY